MQSPEQEFNCGGTENFWLWRLGPNLLEKCDGAVAGVWLVVGREGKD